MSYGDCSDCDQPLPNGEGLCPTCVEDTKTELEAAIAVQMAEAERAEKAEAEVERLRTVIKTGGAMYRAERLSLGCGLGGHDPSQHGDGQAYASTPPSVGTVDPAILAHASRPSEQQLEEERRIIVETKIDLSPETIEAMLGDDAPPTGSKGS